MKRSSPYSKSSMKSKNDKGVGSKGSWFGFLKGVVLANILIVGFLYFTSGGTKSTPKPITDESKGINSKSAIISNVGSSSIRISSVASETQTTTTATQTYSPFKKEPIIPTTPIERPSLPDCTDPEWCSVTMPKKSYFNFDDAPLDPYRWQLAQLQAASGDQVLLERVIKAFPNHFDFLDGDITFRKQHLAMDFFVDEVRDLSPLLPPGDPSRRRLDGFEEDVQEDVQEEGEEEYDIRQHRSLDVFEGGDGNTPVTVFSSENTKDIANGGVRSLQRKKDRRNARKEERKEPLPEEDYSSSTVASMVNGKLVYPWEIRGRRVIPDPYNFRTADRAPIVSICGYTAYRRDSQTYFSGNRVGGAFIDRQTFFKHWRRVKDKIDTPFIAVCSLNENWGFISTNFPNRTAGWGQCCNKMPRDQEVWDFLNHPKTLALVINQHSNVSHPKMMTLPRGLPTTWGSTRVIIWDTQRKNLKKLKKNKLLFAATSSWGPRPQILQCISDKVSPRDFDGHVKNPKGARLDREAYYEKLGSARLGLGLPGLGYDTFRAWELMTMGTVVVLEKAVGFDRSMYRLPALLVEDFDFITPSLLREAYVEALYRADEFEFERLTQGFWWSVMLNVSSTKSTDALLYKFPMKAEEPNFARPRVPFDCWEKGTCGKGTKRPPASSC